MRILVTGAAGFIGSNFVRRMLEGSYPAFADADVTVLDKLTYAGNIDNLAPVADSPRYTFVEGDICDPALLAELMPGHDAVVHFAAESHVDRSITGAADFVLTNVLGTQQLLQAALNADVDRFVHVSTDEVYGSIDSGSWPEDWPLQPNSPYSASKAGSDLIARDYGRTFGMDVRVTRCSNNYGPYQFPEKVIPLFVTNLMDGLPVPLYGSGTNVRDWLHVDDHCNGIQLVLDRGRAGEVDIDLDAFVEEYIAWLLKMQAQRLIDCWIELDVGAMTSERWVQDVRAKMVKAGLGVGLINVWHSNEHDWDYWIHLLEEARQPGRSHYVAIEGHNIVRPELDYRKFLRAAYERNVRVHGFKLTSEDDMRTNPFFSTDSTSWVSPAWHGSKIGMTPTGGVVVRGKSAKVGKNDVMQSGLRRGAKAPERVAALIQSAEAYVKMEQTMTDAWEARGVHWEDPPCRRT